MVSVFIFVYMFVRAHLKHALHVSLFLFVRANGCIALTFWRYHTQSSVTVMNKVKTAYMRHIVGTRSNSDVAD